MHALTFFGALLAVFALASSQSCDEANGWTELNGKCFRVSGNAGETQLTWYEARETCAAEGGDLATFTTLEEQMFVVNKALGIGYTGTLWHGLNQLDDKYFGEFKWADGTNSSFRNWGIGEPKDSGVSNCAFTLTEEASTDFTRYDYSSATQGLLDPGYDLPTSADGIDTFYFGGDYYSDQTWCEEQCRLKEECAAYTWYPYHWDYYWDYTCVGRSDRYDILGYDSYGFAGVRQVAGEPTGENWWFTGNCGLKMAFACSKPIGSDTPVTPAPTSSVGGYCPEGYIGTENKCFRVVTITEELQGFYWSQAVNLCRQGPGISPDLASIHNEEEQSLVAQHLQGLSYGVWIGYHYVTTFDQWVWADNSITRYENWGVGSPGDLTSVCTEMAAFSGAVGDWRNTNCATKKGFVCQTYKDPSNIIENPPPTTPHNCPSGWTPYWYGCYYFDSTQRSWSSARDNCQSLGGNLVSIHSEAENAAVHVLANSFPAWIGLRTDENGDYYWVDGWPYGLYMNWNENGAGAGEGCVAMEGSSMWSDTTCSNTYASVCKITDESPPSTPPGGIEEGYCPLGRWLEFGSNCFYFSDTTYDHSGAISDCRLQGGASHDAVLATIENEYENAFILDNIRNSPDNYWIGLIRSSAGADGFIWLDGSNSQYRKWAPGEPNGPGSENCVEIFSTQYPGMWNDQRCEYYDYMYRRYVCKAKKGDQPSTPFIPTPGDQECPSGNWDVYGDTCLLIRPNDYRNWDEALALCKQMGGQNASLASIHSSSENYFIHAKVREYNIDEYYDPDVWIGMYKYTIGYPYVWEDGKDVNFTNWAPGEPNDQDGSSNCVRMYQISGEWDDYYCYESYNLGYVCQVRQDLYMKELAEKGPGHFLHPDDVIPNKNRHPPAKKQKAPVVVADVIPEANEIDQADDEVAVHDAGSSNASQEMAIVFGSLLGVVLIAAFVSLAVMVVIGSRSPRNSAHGGANLQMDNVLATPPQSGEGYDQATA